MLKQLVKFLSALLHNIFVAILIGIIGLPVLISWATGTLNILFQTIKSPTPLWATIALALLLGIYIYLKIHTTNQSLQKPSSILIEIGQFKWKTEIYKNGDFKVHSIPYCKEHEIKLVPHGIGYFCPAIQLGCKSQIKKKGIKVQHDTAKSFIEGMINKTSKC